MQFFKKINTFKLSPPAMGWGSLQGNELYSTYDSGGVQLEYYSLLDHDLEHCLGDFKFGHPPDRITYSVLSGIGFLPAHQDHGFITTLNYYICADSDITTFYRRKNSDVVPHNYKQKKRARIYHLVDLINLGNFIAVDGSAYLLDVSKIHSVTKVSLKPRVFISFQWQHIAFDDVNEFLLC